ncbi:DUF6270 domain-containing protein [Arthrobacter sp. TMP15]|uniref:DUF6270 domain-containing protein n=1 Tax=Arthrobacter sp. TMP15 TaxID=3140789 RepID=UPI0031BAED8E
MISGQAPERDYSRWTNQKHLVWSSAENFFRDSKFADGIHTLKFGDGAELDIMLRGLNSQSQLAVPVFFSGAVQDRARKSGPFFSGETIAHELSIPFISIADPGLEIDGSTHIAWYAGSLEFDVVTAISSLLESIATRLDRELLLIGGCAGGFAAILFGTILGDRASVLAWNPQTDILRYAPSFVQQYLVSAFAENFSTDNFDADWREKAKIYLDGIGVETSLMNAARNQLPRRMFIIQNASDWHVREHTAPLINHFGMDYWSRGLHTKNSSHAIWITDFGEGHAPLPSAAVASAIKEFLTPAATIDSVQTSLIRTGFNAGVQPGTEPRSLTHIADRLIQEMKLVWKHDRESQSVEIEFGRIPPHFGGLRFGFFTELDSGQLHQLRWFSSVSSFKFSGKQSTLGKTITVKVQDGFGQAIGALNMEVPPKKNRIFIYGSCVSRDPFSFEHDFELVDYVARSSLGSAFASPPDRYSLNSPPDLTKIDSAFQRRMVKIDVEKRLHSLLLDSNFDVLLLDLIDERLQLFPFCGTYLTYSVELQRSGVSSLRAGLIPPGSSEFFKLWETGLEKLIHACSPTRIIVNKTYWATHMVDGSPLPQQDNIARNNDILDALYARLASLDGIRFIEYPTKSLVADSDHKWGVAPYHYVPGAGEHLLASLEMILRQP